ncbi:uncharacterized protein J8A68_005061 [[Candida] subhashii]|uniref:Uncharacterized protein n=1 Tax=[Candida] subhashii TaxID=561895 RepID=A0A8J5QG97_9ASCO|nr:uncharacterized protein J8A68_005061 [[Candida] subhashii]KAG7661483.1 hypothetical protein J8A68_005061 [[Candida] subhashii]
MSNSCPTCRKRFHQIQISQAYHPHKIINTISIQDKLLPNQGINDIPSQFIIPRFQIQPIREDEYEDEENGLVTNGVCWVVDSGNGYLNWCCPMCDFEQESILPRRVLPILGASVGVSSDRVRRRPNLIIHNENNELDIDFLYENQYPTEMNSYEQPIERTHSTVINGGVILRREEKARQRLTEEEMNSWQLFDQAKAQTDINTDTSIGSSSSKPTRCDITPTSSDKKRRRRKKITPIEPTKQSTTDTHKPQIGPSRISSLINQVRSSHNSKPNTKPSIQPPPPPQQPQFTTFQSFPSADSPISPSSNKSGNIGPGSSGGGYINTEEDYVSINKSISRLVYNHILNEAGAGAGTGGVGGERTEDVFDRYFNDDDPTKLQEIVDRYAKNVLLK